MVEHPPDDDVGVLQTDEPERRVSFLPLAAGAFGYPFETPNNAIGTGFIMLTAVLAHVACFAPIYFALVGVPILLGLLASTLLRVLAESARGDDDVPEISADGDWLGGIAAPAVRFVAAIAAAFVPAVAYAAAAEAGWIGQSRPVLIGLTMAGAVVWPMVLLLIALESAPLLLRPDLIAVTIARTLGSYLVLMILLAVALSPWLLWLSPLIQEQLGIGGLPRIGLLTGITAKLLVAYLSLVGMRLVGLYYRHEHERFAFQLE